MRILAASSLTDVLPRALERYEADHPDVAIETQFGGSQALATQIEADAPADLFLSANRRQVERLASAGLVESPVTLVENRLVVAVEEGSGVRTLEDLTPPGVRIAIAAAGVPVGELTHEALDRLPEMQREAILANVITHDMSVRVALSRVELGEADAAFVYATDLVAAPGLRAIELADLGMLRNEYVGAITADAGEEARAILEFLRSEEAQSIFEQAGFVPLDESREADD